MGKRVLFSVIRTSGLEFAWWNKYNLPSEGQEEDSPQETVNIFVSYYVHLTCFTVETVTSSIYLVRWSQIMYMYYFLGYQLDDDPSLRTEKEKEHRANNTFLLALDGDVDFQPDAIIKVCRCHNEIMLPSCRLSTWWRETPRLVQPVVESTQLVAGIELLIILQT